MRNTLRNFIIFIIVIVVSTIIFSTTSTEYFKWEGLEYAYGMVLIAFGYWVRHFAQEFIE